MLERTLEKAFYAIGDKAIAMATGEHKNFADREIREENVTSELVVRPRVQASSAAAETRESLNQYTKLDICERAAEQFGADLNFRLDKATLIRHYLDEQSKS